jgi:ABC-2 type transport system ATP-binding protein
VIEVKNLTKKYGDHIAVEDLSFTVKDGRIYGLLGPNGAGKTTTMNIMTGCLGATSGVVRIDGLDIFDEPEKIKRKVGYLPELPPLYPDMTPMEFLKFVAKARGVTGAERTGQIEKVIAIAGIEEMQDRLIKNLSKGYRQRVGIAQALLGNPEVVILDEPTVGLDPKQIIEIRDLIKNLGKDHTVILSSHILGEVQAVCDHILIISRGKLVASGTPDELEKQFAGSSTVNLSVKADRARATQVLDGMDGVSDVEVKSEADGVSELCVSAQDGGDVREALFTAFSKANVPILNMTLSKASLEDIFLEFTEEEPAQGKRGKEAGHGRSLRA